MTKNNKNKIRNNIQSKITKAIIKNNYSGYIDVAPRVGKSKAVIDSLKGKGNRTIYVSSPFTDIKNNWLVEANTWGLDYKLNSITHRSLKKLPDNIDLLIIDEVQELSPANYQTIISKNPTRILALSGTLNDETIKKITILLGLKCIYKYSIDQAIRDKIISDFSVTVKYLTLDDTTNNVKSGSKYKSFYTTEKKAYDYLTMKFEKVSEEAKIDFSLLKLKEYYARMRKELIYNSISKINKVKEEYNKSQDRLLLYCATVNTANIITNNGPTYTYKDKKEGVHNLKKFQNKEISKLGVINMVSMGITIPDLKHILIQQLQSNSEMSIQKFLRACNMDNDNESNSNNKARIVIYCYKDTVDEKWVQSALTYVDNKKVKYKNL